MIILKFAAERRDRADDDVGISQSDLKDYMTSKNLGQIDNMGDLDKFHHIIKAVVDRMIKTAGMLIVSDPGEGLESRVLKIDPTYYNQLD